MEYQQIMAVHGVKGVVSTLACGLESNGFHGCGWFFGTLLGPEITGPDISYDALWGVCGVLGSVFSGLSRAWPKPARYPSFGGCVGGGCDGVVVWELYSGREHLVKQD